MTVQVITQEGKPVGEPPKVEPEDVQDDAQEIPGFEADVRAMAEDMAKGIRRFKNGIILKIGLVAVAIKVVDVVGKIVIENQRLKAAQKPEDDE